jgi:hypothetical protein
MVLARIGGAALCVELPVSVDGSQRVTLAVRAASDLPEASFEVAPYLWDPALGDRLRAALGGCGQRVARFAADATPLPPQAWGDGEDAAARAERTYLADDAGDVVAAWATAGIALDPALPDPNERWWRPRPENLRLPLDAFAVAEQAREILSSGLVDEVLLDVDYHTHVRIVLAGDGLTARFGRRGYADDDEDKPGTVFRLSADMCRRYPDLDLLWHGLISTGDLHPAVRDALFPTATAQPSMDEPPAGPVRVRCRGVWHQVRNDSGRLHMLDHTAAEAAREQILLGLGGTVTGCFAAQRAWSGGGGRLPKALRAQRIDLWQRMLHGGTDAVVELLDAGLDPHVRDGRGMTLLHMLLAFDHRVLLPRLLDAGLDINAIDKEQRTPLHVAVVVGHSGDLIRALVDAGADPHLVDQDQMSAIDFIDQVLKYRERSPEFTAAIEYLREHA